MTITEAVSATTNALGEAGVETPRLDAELLLGHLLGWERRRLLTYPETVLANKVWEALQSLTERRRKREPLAYILGEWEFYGRSFHVTADVLVPRPETELLVEAALRHLSDRGGRRSVGAFIPRGPSLTVVDVGTGSGAIAVTLAAEMPGCRVIGLDVSAAALTVAQTNARRHGVGERVVFRQGDLLAPLREERVNVLLANLPYVADADYATLMPEVVDYEPAVALRGGVDGLAVIRRLVVQAPSFIEDGGLLGLEVGEDQAATVKRLLQAGGWTKIRTVTDYGGIARHVLAIWGRATLCRSRLKSASCGNV